VAAYFSLIFLAFLLSFTLDRVNSDLFVILLQGSKILTGLRELSLLHTLSDVPVDESTLGVHEIELVVDAGKSLGDGGGVGNHAYSTLHTGQVTSGNNGRGLIVDTALESSGAPVDELHGSLGLDGGDGRVDILGDNVSSEHHAASHELSVTRIALGHHVGGLEHGVTDLLHGKLLVVGLLSRDDGSVRGKHEMDTRVGHQVGLELGKIHVEGTIETKGSSQRGNNLGDQSVQVGVGRTLDIQRASAHIVKSLVIKAEGAVGVLQKRVGRKHVVVGLNNGGGDLRGRSDGERKLGLPSVVNGKSLKKKRSETRSSSSTGGVEDHKSLKTGTVISKLSDAVKAKVNNLLSDGVVTTGVIVGGILLSGDQLLRVVKLSVGSGTYFVNHSRLKIKVHGSGDVLSGTSLREKGIEGVITTTDGLVRRHLSIGLDSVLETKKLPGSVSGLDTGLSNVKAKALSHFEII